MVIKCVLKPNTPLTPGEIAMIESAKKKPIEFDEDSPELTPKTRAAFRRAAAERKARLEKQASGN